VRNVRREGYHRQRREILQGQQSLQAQLSALKLELENAKADGSRLDEQERGWTDTETANRPEMSKARGADSIKHVARRPAA
jgi:hypothetical protein